MPNDLLPKTLRVQAPEVQTLVILEPKKLIGESLQAVFTAANVFSRVALPVFCGAGDWPKHWECSPVFPMKIDGPPLFLVAVRSYLQAVQTIQQIQVAQPEATIVILDEQFRSGCGILARDTTVHGYWTFQETSARIIDGILRASRRCPSISPLAGNHLRHSRRKGVQIGLGLLEHPYYKLSRREQQLFHLIADGKTIEVCAAEMSIAKKTAYNLREKLMKKFDVLSGTDLVWKAMEIGLVDLCSKSTG